MQAIVLRVSIAGHRNMAKPVSPIELRVDMFVGRDQKAEPGAVNSRWFVRFRRAFDVSRAAEIEEWRDINDAGSSLVEKYRQAKFNRRGNAAIADERVLS